MEEIGQILSGTNLAKEIKQELTERVHTLQERVTGFKPGLSIIQVGNREDSNVYIRMKIKTANDIGLNAEHISLPKTTTEIELLTKIRNLNNDQSVHGIIVQMPLESDTVINSHLITDAVSQEKDVDGLNTINEGRVAIGDLSGFIPCTPYGCVELIKKTGVPIAGSTAVVLGRSKIVGTPVAELLKWHNATVTICHSKTKDIDKICLTADILVIAIGKPEYVKGSWIKKGAVVIDCGINSVPDSTKKSGKKLLGDCAFEECKQNASYITPVPGGVGPMTVAMLIQNTVLSAERFIDKFTNVKWSLSPLSLQIVDPVPKDIVISRQQQPKEIKFLTKEIGLFDTEVIPYGNKFAKISCTVLKRLECQSNGKLVVVTGITPTPLGEGKSTTTIGLVQALVSQKNRNAIATIRQPSQGPTFGIKGGAAGGGYSQVIPMEEFNLHLSGDIHAISAANNLLAAQVETRMFHESTQKDRALYDRLVPTDDYNVRAFNQIQLKRLKKLGINKTDPNLLTDEEKRNFARLDIDPETIFWERVIDTNDRFLRKITIGQSATEKGFIRETKFKIAVSSEIMAIVALAKNMADMKERISKIVIGFDKNGNPITADDLGVTGGMMILLKDVLKPTLMQTLEGTPVLVHCGPFANTAHGCSSIIADNIALKLVGKDGFTVTEAGFGTDIGLEKFCNIKARYSGIKPDAAVLVCTVRALKLHGGGPKIIDAHSHLADEYYQENTELVTKGLPNLLKHLENVLKFGLNVIVAINAFNTDTEQEWNIIREFAINNGASAAVVCHHFARGGDGAQELADAVINACDNTSKFRYLYDTTDSLQTKIETIAKEIYGAAKVEIPQQIKKKLNNLVDLGLDQVPVCMAKTANSLTGDPTIKGAPKNFTINVQDIYLSAGAGFIVVTVGEISQMPGLPTRPSFYDMDLNVETGEIYGLF